MNSTKQASRQPLLHIVKRAELPRRTSALLRLGAFLLSLFIGGLFILALGYNPFEIYGTIVSGSFRSAMAIQATIKVMVPLLISSLAVTLAFKMKFWNIGAEGQIIMGATFATYFALFHSDWNHWVLILVMLLAGMIGGGLWGLIPAVLKTRFRYKRDAPDADAQLHRAAYCLLLARWPLERSRIPGLCQNCAF